MQNCEWLFYYFNFERSYDVFPERRRKWKFPHIVLERRTLCFSSFKNRKLKVNLWWVGARERKKRASFVPFILPEGDFFNICVLSQCIKYLIYFQNLHTFTYQKTLLYTLLVFVFKVVKSLQYIFKIAKFSGYCSALVYL